MTVHGAKGLEASVVFLVDTTSSPSDTQRLRLIHLPDGRGGKVVVWAGRKAEDPAPVAQARQAMLADTEDEYRRLLYVAMTRAADRLIVGGCMPGNTNTVRRNSWYDLIDKGLGQSGLQEQTIETPDGPIKRFSRAADELPAAGTPAVAARSAASALPDWLVTPLPARNSLDNLLRPSDAGGAGRGVKSGESVLERSRAMQRGTLVHRLLQSLPDVAPGRRRDAASAYLARNAIGWSEGERNELAENVMALIDDPRFAAVFAAGSRAEVSIVGRLELPGRPLVSGQIDRLVVTDKEVLIVDFKTNHSPPTDRALAPPVYVRQLALYRAVLGKLYPQRAIRAALVWTEAPDFMEILAPALDAALASLDSGRQPA
jgi:ATP-dependent helicase/nuclease subunit A